jgi:hypothetical protein
MQPIILINIKNFVILSDTSGASSPGFIVKDGPDMTDNGSVSGSLPHRM